MGKASRRKQRPQPPAGRRRRSAALSRWQLVGGGAVVAIALVAGGFAVASARRNPLAELGDVKQFTVTDRSHVSTPVRYPQIPPVGGPHAPVWQNCGAYTTPVRNEQAVHSLEHGAVWITYRPDLPADQTTRLDRLARQRTYVLVSPYPGLPAPIVASAWGAQARFTSAADSHLNAFVRGFRQGAQTPEPGAPCTNGSGAPA